LSVEVVRASAEGAHVRAAGARTPWAGEETTAAPARAIAIGAAIHWYRRMSPLLVRRKVKC
jgi:hypothetical protein